MNPLTKLFGFGQIKEEPKEEVKDDPLEIQPLELDIAKHRNGATKVINFSFQAGTSAIFTTESNSYRKED